RPARRLHAGGGSGRALAPCGRLSRSRFLPMVSVGAPRAAADRRGAHTVVTVDAQTPGRVRQLGDILLDEGLVTAEQLSLALAEQQRLGHTLGRVLVDQGTLTES